MEKENEVTGRKIKNMYLFEMNNQCGFALTAFDDLRRAALMHDAFRIWYFIHAFLTSTGNISKLLWPSLGDKKEHIERKEKLRKSLSIGDDSPLRNRKFRNYLEHFDRELQNWVKTTTKEDYIDISFGSLDKVKQIHSTLENFLRYFDDKKFIIVFRGDEAELLPVVEAIKKLNEKAQEEIRNIATR